MSVVLCLEREKRNMLLTFDYNAKNDQKHKFRSLQLISKISELDAGRSFCNKVQFNTTQGQRTKIKFAVAPICPR